MATMKVQNYKKYNNEYTPSWVKPTAEEKEREEKYYKRLVEEGGGKSKSKKIKKEKKKVLNHNGKKSAKKFYAIKNGKKKNVIVKTWIECSKLVLGYPNAIYKGFNTEDEAKKFLGI